MATDYLKEAKNAMDKAANYGNQAEPVAMVAQTHFASAAALIAIAERMEELLQYFEGYDGSGLGVSVSKR